MHVQINEFAPGECLKPFVAQFWSGDFNLPGGNSLRQRVVPNGYVELVIHLTDQHCDLKKGGSWMASPEYTIIGLHTSAYEVQFCDNVQVFGIRFKPEGFFRVFGLPAAEFGNTFDDIGQVAGREFSSFCSQLKHSADLLQMLYLSEDYLWKRLKKNQKQRQDYLNHAAEIIRQSNGFIRMEELAKQIFISPRQLERSFKRQIGISPKHYMRIARLNEVQRQLERAAKFDFTGLSYECGYSDQAHFIRDFRRFTGEKPSAFVKNRGQFIVNAR